MSQLLSQKIKNVTLATRNPDLGLTLLLWLAEDLAPFLTDPSQRVRIEEGSRGFEINFDDPAHLILKCNSSMLELHVSKFAEISQKVKKRLGLAQTPFALKHEQVIQRYAEFRNQVREKIGNFEKPRPRRFLLRVDDFPSLHGELHNFKPFHAAARAYGIPYLLAVTPFLDRGNGPSVLAETELKILQQCVREGATLALHGFTHKTRIRHYGSELVSMPAEELEENILKAKNYFHSHQLKVPGFVAPFNTYDAKTLSIVARHFSFFCGGPESVLSLGARIGPSFFKESLYVPSYHGVYDLKSSDMPAFETIASPSDGFILPVTLHWANEVRDGFKNFGALCRLLKNRMLTWEQFSESAATLKAAAKGNRP
jgi:hypothetical protein